MLHLRIARTYPLLGALVGAVACGESASRGSPEPDPPDAAISCEPPTLLCGELCIDPQTNPQHCALLAGNIQAAAVATADLANQQGLKQRAANVGDRFQFIRPNRVQKM